MAGKSIEELVKEEKGIVIHGHSLRITFQYQGVRCRETLGLEPTKPNLKFAVNLKAAINHEIKMGTFDYAKHFPDSKNAKKYGKVDSEDIKHVTIGDLSERYLELKKVDIGIQTEKGYANAIKQCVNAIGKDQIMSELTGEDMMIMRSDLVETRAASSVNTYCISFTQFLEFAFNSGYTKQQLHKSLKRLKSDKKPPDPFEQDEFEQLIECCNCQEFKHFLILSVYTGMRTGEVCALAWEDIDFDKKTILVRRSITEKNKFKLPKTDKERTVYLMPPAIEALKKQKRHTFMAQGETIQVHQKDKRKTKDVLVRPVFRKITENGVIENEWNTAPTLRHGWRQTVKRSGIRRRPMYQTRHTYACWGLTAHGNVAFIANQMGHSDLNMVSKTYGTWMDSGSEQEADFIWSQIQKKRDRIEKSQK